MLSCHTMIDTDADINVANPLILSKLETAGVDLIIGPSEKKFIIAASDEQVEIEGMINVDLKVGETCSKIKFYLVPRLTPHLILDLDFFKSSESVVDFKAKKLLFDPRRALISKSGITVPPKSEIVIAAKIKGEQLPEDV